MQKYLFLSILFFILSRNLHAQNSFVLVKNKTKTDTVFYISDKKAAYKNGNQIMMDSLAMLLSYPPEARINKEIANINLQFVVSKNGLAKNPAFVDIPFNKLLFDESLKKLNLFLTQHRLDWQIAENKGKKVEAFFLLSIEFLPEKKMLSEKNTSFANSYDTIVVSSADKLFLAKKIVSTKDSLSEKLYDNKEVDVPAEFKGGQQELAKWYEKNLVYPAWAREKNIKGRVVVKLTIDENGKVINPVITSDTPDILNQEVLRLISIMPDWIPAKHNGKNVTYFYTMLGIFKLE
jgi:TonB family protein